MNQTAESISVEWDEALDISTDMKLRARDLQLTGDSYRKSGDNRTASVFDAKAARLESFADKLLTPFLGEDGIADLNSTIEA